MRYDRLVIIMWFYRQTNTVQPLTTYINTYNIIIIILWSATNALMSRDVTPKTCKVHLQFFATNLLCGLACMGQLCQSLTKHISVAMDTIIIMLYIPQSKLLAKYCKCNLYTHHDKTRRIMYTNIDLLFDTLSMQIPCTFIFS